MTYAEAIQFLYGLQLFGANFGLETPRWLAALAGNPHEKLRFIHVAGTNGKGSTCAMLESIYRAAGLRVGLYTSPHLVLFRERIQINRRLIGEAEVARLVEKMRAQCSGFRPQASPGPAKAGTPNPDTSPTFFEFVTVLALEYFAEQKCDLVIWETGLGGRLDATNIVTPLASVITNIQFDHQQWLGDTLAKIAAEKAGIIKPGVPVLTAADGEALEVIEQVARKENAPLKIVTKADEVGSSAFRRPESQNPPNRLKAELQTILPLPGAHQQLNAALAIATIRALQKQIPVSEDQIRSGLVHVNWPGRLQLITRADGQRFLLDGAHNPAGAESLRAVLEGAPASGTASFDNTLHLAVPEAGAPTLILGILGDKDWPAMCEILAPLAARILLVPVGSERTATPEELAEVCRRVNPTAKVACCGSLADALAQTAKERFVIISGSLYLVGEALELFGISLEHAANERALNEWGAVGPQKKPR